MASYYYFIWDSNFIIGWTERRMKDRGNTFKSSALRAGRVKSDPKYYHAMF